MMGIAEQIGDNGEIVITEKAWTGSRKKPPKSFEIEDHDEAY